MQPHKFCWTYVFNDVKANRGFKIPPLFQDLFEIPLFSRIKSSYDIQIIWITSSIKVRHDIEVIHRYLFSWPINLLGSYDFYLVTEVLQFYHLNQYYRPTNEGSMSSQIFQTLLPLCLTSFIGLIANGCISTIWGTTRIQRHSSICKTRIS